MSGLTISDHWIATEEEPYWIDSSETIKRHEFDAEYWLTLQPIYSSYITAGDDNSNYPPQKYDGLTPKKIELTALKPGITSSENYPEQLVYIYGLNKMSDIGDMSNLYWREFYLEGKANKLTRLKLGHDGKDKDENTWYNKQLNGISIPDLPLLKEMNLCNISLSTEQTLNLEKSEKLQNFRATGMSKLTEVKFAPGVSLKTLYLPSCIKAFTLSEANNLKVLLKDYKTPLKNSTTGLLEAEEGLYLENFFTTSDFQLIKIDINGGALRENSYDIFKHFVNSKLKNSSTGKGSTIKMKNFDWNKYSQLVEGDEYVLDDDSLYYCDNKHCGFSSYNYTGEDQFKKDILNGIVYKKRTDFNSSIDTSDAYELLQKLSKSEMIFELTGSLWIDNSSASEIIDEYDVFSLINTHFPKLSVYFEDSSKINKAYMAQFVSYNEDQDYSVQIYSDNGDPLIQKIDKDSLNPRFNYPIYEPKKSYHDFIGWSKTKIDKVETSVEGYYNIDGDKLFYKDSAFTEKLIIGTNANKYLYKDKNTDKIYTFESGNYYLMNDFIISDTSIDTYVYYAVFQKKEYTITYNLGDSQETIIIKYGEPLQAPKKIPSKTDSSLELTQCYKFIGYSREEDGKIVQLEGLRVSRDETFYAIFDIDSVYNNVHPEYFNFFKTGYIDGKDTSYDVGEGYQISPNPNFVLSGKITIPTEYSVDGKIYPVIGLSDFKDQKDITHIFFENSNNVRYINTNCFKDCSNLLYFDFIDSIRIIHDYAFFNSNLSLVNYISNPNGLLYSIGESAFNGTKCGLNNRHIYICSPLLQIFKNTAFAYLKFDSSFAGDIIFEINAKSLKTIGSRVFSQNTRVFEKFIVYELNDQMQGSFKNAFDDSYHNVDEIIDFRATEMPV